jgi:hypothetical protein
MNRQWRVNSGRKMGQKGEEMSRFPGSLPANVLNGGRPTIGVDRTVTQEKNGFAEICVGKQLLFVTSERSEGIFAKVQVRKSELHVYVSGVSVELTGRCSRE